MEANSILTANILDILFDGRNKEYGAYDLRKTYEKRIGFALGITIIVILIFTSIITATGSNENTIITKPEIDVNLSNERKREIILPKPVVIPKSVQVRAIADLPPIIVKDILVKETPIENKDLDNTTLGLKNLPGETGNEINAPVEIPGSNVMETPANKEIKEELPFEKVEIEAKFNGNWNKYLQKEIEKNMDELTEAGESGTCVVRFVVSKDGTVSEVEATTMKGTKLAEVSVNAIRKGPKWIPAIQNGIPVNAYRHQPITFKISD